VRPRLRGVSHQYAFVVASAAGAALILLAPTSRARLASLVYALALAALFGVSALYHRITWSPATRQRLRRLDHSMIFLLIAGTYTPISVLVLPGAFAAVVLATVWVAALAGVAWQVVVGRAPRWLSAALYLALGWVALATLPQLAALLAPTALALLAAGGVFYSVGAVIYALRRPDPWPRTFGYHEIFHALVILAAGAHFAMIAWYFVRPA